MSSNGSAEHVSFSDVARAHHKWDKARGDGSTTARDAYEATLAAFEEQSHSKVVEAYWCRQEASAVALAKLDAQEPGRLTRLLRRDDVPDFRLYRETDWVVTGNFARLADLLHQCDVLAIKAIYGLEGFQRALVMQWLLRVESHILGYIEWRHPTNGDAGDATKRGRPAPNPMERFTRQTVDELNKIEDYYQQAGEKRARLRYVEGMLVLGLVAVALAALASAGILAIFGLFHVHHSGVRRFYACMIAGAIGAVVSVLIRMSGRRGGFTIDHELGAVGIMRLGGFRPIIGAVSGVIVSLLIQTPLIPIDQGELTIELFVVVAFLAGFSERWTQVVLTNAMRTIDKSDDDGDAKTK